MKKTRSTNINTAINIISSMGVLLTNICISFFLSPYIIRTIGVEANGFVNLANNFVAYADILVTALNAMAARFITIAYVNKDYKRANLYYNSVFWGNLIIVAVLLIPAVMCIVRLEYVINVPKEIMIDVKILFTLAFLGFFVRTGAPNWDCGTSVTNRLELTYVPSIITSIFRCIALVCMFVIWNPHVWYVGLVSFVVTMINLAVAGINTHRLTPKLKISLKHPICSFKTIKELVGSGVWNSIALTGNMLFHSLDLLMCNVFLGATQMGILSVSKSIPSIMNTFSESLRGAFGPELTISYAKGDRDEMLKSVKRAMKIMGVIVPIPFAGVVVMSDAFYALWLPSQDAKLLQLLTTLALLNYLFNSGVIILYNIFVVVNKVRYNSVATIITGVVSILVTLIIIKFTDYDLYAVAGVSSLVMICRELVFTIPVTSRLIGYKWYQFYPQVLMSIISSGLVVGVGMVVRLFIPVDSWGMFFLACFVIGITGLILNSLIVLNKDERNYFVNLLKRNVQKRK